MSLTQIILAVNTAGVLAIGAITFFISYTTFQGLDDPKIKEFAKRFLMLNSVLILTASYLLFYTEFFAASNTLGALFPLYLLLAITFILLIYSGMAFEDIASSYGISNEKKIDKMENEEIS